MKSRGSTISDATTSIAANKKANLITESPREAGEQHFAECNPAQLKDPETAILLAALLLSALWAVETTHF